MLDCFVLLSNQVVFALVLELALPKCVDEGLVHVLFSVMVDDAQLAAQEHLSLSFFPCLVRCIKLALKLGIMLNQGLCRRLKIAAYRAIF